MYQRESVGTAVDDLFDTLSTRYESDTVVSELAERGKEYLQLLDGAKRARSEDVRLRAADDLGRLWRALELYISSDELARENVLADKERRDSGAIVGDIERLTSDLLDRAEAAESAGGSDIKARIETHTGTRATSRLYDPNLLRRLDTM